jgi:hypothetical protein
LPVGTLVLPDESDVLLGVAYGAGGTEFVGTFDPAAGGLPDTPTLDVIDRGDGSGGDVSITGSTPGSTNRVYFTSYSSTGVFDWALAGTRTGDGAVAIDAAPGSYLVRVESSSAGATVQSAIYFATFTAAVEGHDNYDTGDGNGIHVSFPLIETPPIGGATNFVQVKDTSQGDWRTVYTRQLSSGGMYTIPVNDTVTGVTTERSYWVRVNTNVGGLISYGTETLVTPTSGYGSDVFGLMIQLKHDLIRANIARIGGRVFHCIDPREIKVLPQMPAIFIFQAEPETSTPQDNRTTSYDLPITVQVCDTLDGDWVRDTEWWLHTRFELFRLAHRQHTDRAKRTGAGRRWKLVPGMLLADDWSKYRFRGHSLTFRADAERLIGG